MFSRVQVTVTLCALTLISCFVVNTLLYESPITEGKLESRSRPADSASADISCRSLFTITDFASGNMEVESVATDNINQKITQSVTTAGFHEVARVVGHLQQLRDSMYRVATTHYQTLAFLLPTLITFSNNSVRFKTNEAQQNSTLTSGISRIAAAGGVLPYVPCTIQPYDKPASFISCLRKRLKKHTSFTIEFIGDSKVRNLFYAFLEKTNPLLHYQVKYTGMVCVSRNYHIIEPSCDTCNRVLLQNISVLYKNLLEWIQIQMK